jgi:hypothetical protein
LPLLQAAAFIGATLCGIIHLHGLMPCVYLAGVKFFAIIRGKKIKNIGN